MLEKKATAAFSFLNQQTSPFIMSVRVFGLYGQKRTHSTQPLRALDKTHSNCLFSKDVVDLAFEAFVDDRVLKEEGETAPKLKHGVLVQSFTLKAVSDKGLRKCENSSQEKRPKDAPTCTISVFLMDEIFSLELLER